MDLSPFVNLYRISGKPGIDNGVFSGMIECGPENLKIIQDLRAGPNSPFEELLIDGSDVTDSAKLPKQGNRIEFSLRLPGDSAETFHESIRAFIHSAPQLSRGQIPQEFYLINEDYYSQDQNPPEPVSRLNAICEFIRLLSKLAHYHDSKTTDHHFKLVFLQPDEGKAAVEIETRINPTILSYEPPDVCLIDELCLGDIRTDPHFSAKRGVFGVTLIEFMNKRPLEQNKFEWLIHHWREFIILYQQNLGTYLSGFAFHKVKQEIAEKQFYIAEKLSKITSEITGKLLSIPISFAVIIAIVKSDILYEKLILVIGLLLAALVVAGSVKNQQKQLERIRHSKQVTFNSFEGNKDLYPVDIQIDIKKMVAGLDRNETYLFRLLWFFRVLSWVPVTVSALIVYCVYA